LRSAIDHGILLESEFDPSGYTAGDRVDQPALSAAIHRDSSLTKRNEMALTTQDRFRGALLGLASGDAVGTTVEFEPRGSFMPMLDMVGGGPFHLEPGQWTDDTSMALCLAASLLEKGFDPTDQMDRYCHWYCEGYMSSKGRCFDIGTTVRDSLDDFEATGEPFSGATHPNSAGNGCIMRLAPVPMYFYPNREEAIRMSAESSRTTHGTAECLEACQLLAAILYEAFSDASKEQVLSPGDVGPFQCEKISAIAGGTWKEKLKPQIRGSGYVVDCLEAALWCFDQTDSFEAAILTAANLGDDADTTAAVCGQIAGAFYGESGIPPSWLEKLTMAEEIRAMADQLVSANPTRS
jgi:ADP-ribosyl-[dinitrogen reductase] hydrolase